MSKKSTCAPKVDRNKNYWSDDEYAKNSQLYKGDMKKAKNFMKSFGTTASKTVKKVGERAKWLKEALAKRSKRIEGNMK